MNDRNIHLIVSASRDDHGKLLWHIVDTVDYLDADICVWDETDEEWSAMNDHDHTMYRSMITDLCNRLSINEYELPEPPEGA
jgi:hypothetical protein